MDGKRAEPDEGIYRSVLQVCGRFRKRPEASDVFGLMKRDGIKPASATYAAYAR
jgi:pentatricopeptide repeat protein